MVKNIFKRFSVVQWIVIVLCLIVNVFIIVNSCLPGRSSTSTSSWIVLPIKAMINAFKANTINDGNIGILTLVVRKVVGHFLLFTLSGFLTTLTFKFTYYNPSQKYWRFLILSSISGLFLAFLTEFIQFFTPERSGEITDVLLDFFGYFIGVLVIGLITYFKRNEISNMENQK